MIHCNYLTVQKQMSDYRTDLVILYVLMVKQIINIYNNNKKQPLFLPLKRHLGLVPAHSWFLQYR